MTFPPAPPGSFAALDKDSALSDRQFQRKLASYEAERDLYKHITTLSTGSIVLMATLRERLLAGAGSEVLVAISLGGFAFSIVGCVIMHLLSVIHTDKQWLVEYHVRTSWVSILVMVAGFGGFAAGIIALTAFVAVNLF